MAVNSQPSPPSTADLQSQYDTLEAHFRQRADILMKALIAGTIGLSAWRTAMQEELRRFHLAAALIATGGTLAANIAAIAQRRIAEQMQYFNQWADSLSVGTAESDAALLSRMALYFAAGFGTLYMALTAWLGLPDLPYQPGVLTRCYGNCRCEWDYKMLSSGNWNLTWIRFEGDSCETCKAREDLANPLLVRDGQVVEPERYFVPEAYYFG